MAAGVEGGGGWGEEVEREVKCGSAMVGAGTSDPMKECWGEGRPITTEQRNIMIVLQYDHTGCV